MDWKKQVSKNQIGDNHHCAMCPGYSFKPKKYSIPGKEEINEASVRMLKDLPEDMKRAILKKGNDGESGLDEIITELSIDEQIAIVGVSNQSEILKLKLKYGIFEHDFFNDAEIKEKTFSREVSEQFVEDLLQFPDLVVEIVGVIEDINRPLANETTEISGM